MQDAAGRVGRRLSAVRPKEAVRPEGGRVRSCAGRGRSRRPARGWDDPLSAVRARRVPEGGGPAGCVRLAKPGRRRPSPLPYAGVVTPAELSALVLRTVHRAVDAGRLPVPSAALPPRVVVESPPARGVGDYGTAAALRLAPALGVSARHLATWLCAELAGVDGLGRVEVAGPGFLDVTLAPSARARLVRALAARPAPRPDEWDAAGPDLANWAAATGDDPERLATRTEAASPLFRVQYANSRVLALLRAGRALQIEPRAEGGHAYAEPAERALLALLADAERYTPNPAEDGVSRADGRPGPDGAPRRGAVPTREVGTPPPAPAPRVAAGRGTGGVEARVAGGPVRRAAVRGGARSAARHLQAVADAFHHWTATCPTLPRGDEKPEAAHRAGLALAEAVSVVLLRGLSQLGVTAPVRI